jgi:Zn-dependent peptidase ImmA (M78 family)/transcriptional regulator with XRE-family HTH domain
MDRNVLDTIDMGRLGSELQQARMRSGLTQEDAARIIEVARTTLTSIETGKRRVKADELIKLAQAYGRQVSDLVRPRPDVAMSQPQFRGPTLRTLEDTEKIAPYVEKLKELAQNYFELEKKMEAPHVQKYPREYDVEGLPVESAAESVAMEERNRLGLGDGPIAMLRDVLEQDVGLRIFYVPIPLSKFSAIYLYDEQIGGCIAVNANHPEERRRWSIAHDYGHFLVHRQKPLAYIDDNYRRKPGSERFADDFAFYFLMPTSGLKRRINDIRRAQKGVTIADLCTLAAYYGVSVAAMASRLEEMRLIPTGIWDALKEGGFKVRVAQQKLGLGPLPENADKLPLRYQYLAFDAFEKGLITEGMFARFLEVSRLDARLAAEILSQKTENAFESHINLDGNGSLGAGEDK